jgi:primosomal protein N''
MSHLLEVKLVAKVESLKRTLIEWQNRKRVASFPVFVQVHELVDARKQHDDYEFEDVLMMVRKVEVVVPMEALQLLSLLVLSNFLLVPVASKAERS